MDRREMMAALAALGAATAARAQTSVASMPRVAFVSNLDRVALGPFIDRFIAAMHLLGYVENRDYTLDVRYANNEQSRIAPVVKDAVASRPEVLVVAGLYAARAARDATSTVPVVVVTASDLVDAGIVPSYAHPGGNITGLADLTDETALKRLELLKEALPKATRVALLTNPEFPATPKIRKTVGAAAAAMGITLITVEASDRSSTLSGIDSLTRSRPDALLVGGDNNAVANARDVIARATGLRIPVAYFWPGTAEMGALFSYQADVLGNYDRAAWYVDRILKGAKPGDLPIELPKRYELVVNRKAAAALGTTLPSAFLLRADRVID